MGSQESIPQPEFLPKFIVTWRNCTSKWWFPEIGVPLVIIHFHGSCPSKPSILGYPHDHGKPPNIHPIQTRSKSTDINPRSWAPYAKRATCDILPLMKRRAWSRWGCAAALKFGNLWDMQTAMDALPFADKFYDLNGLYQQFICNIGHVYHFQKDDLRQQTTRYLACKHCDYTTSTQVT